MLALVIASIGAISAAAVISVAENNKRRARLIPVRVRNQRR